MSKLKIGYVREAEETCDFVKNVILYFKRLFNIIKVEEKDGKRIYYLPLYKNTKVSNYRVKKIARKLVSKIKLDNTKNVVLSNYLETLNELKIILYSKNVNILNGRYLFKCLILNVIDYIFKRKNIKTELRRSNDFIK